MTELAKRIVDAYNEKDFNKCEASLLFLALAYNSDIEKGKVYDHDLKHLMFAVNFIRNPLGARYALEDYTSIKSVLFGTIQTLKMINNPENDTSDAFHKELVIDKRIIDDLIDLVTYTYVLYQMNQVNSKRMDDCETWKLPFVEQLLTIFTFFQDQVRILRQDPQTYLHDDYITGMELSVADRPVEYYDSLTSSISDNFESMLEATNELIHYLYFQYGKNIKSEELIENINFDLIRPYGNVDFQRYMYIAGQRTLLRRIEEGIRYGYYSFDSTGRQENGFKYFLFILEDDNKYRARRLGLLRREYQYQNHALMYSLSQPNLAKAYELLTKLADMLVKIQTDKSLLVDISQFHPDSELFQKAEKIAIPKLGVVESLTKDYYLGCQVKGVKISDFLCTYRYLFTLAEVFNTASLHLIDQDIPSTYVKEVCLVNSSYLSSELSRIHNYELKYAEKLIDRFVFHEKNNRFDDVFAQPLLKISNSQVVLSQALMEQVNLDRAIERQFIRFNKNISEVGRKFEEYFINSLSCGYVQSPLDFQRKEIPNFAVNTNKIKYIAFDGKDIEFDMIAMLGDYIILTELKAVMSSYDLDDLEARKKNVKEAVKQLYRREESLLYDWEKIRALVSIKLPERPIDRDHIILVVCTDSYDYTPLKNGKVFITDDSTYLKYFTNPYAHIVKAEEKRLGIATVKSLWAKGYPDAQEFMEYLMDPITIHPISDCIIKQQIPGIVMDDQDFALFYEDYILTQDPVRSAALGTTDYTSEGFINLDAKEWSDKQQAEALDLKAEFESQGILGKQKMKGRDRNKPCPCGSGKKFKNCCGK